MQKVVEQQVQSDIVSKIKTIMSLKISETPAHVLLITLTLFLVIAYTAGIGVNSGSSMNYLGWAYLTNWGETPQIGEVFRFTSTENPIWYRYMPGATQIKRCTGITKDELFLFEGDNADSSADIRDEEQAVPASNISGTIVAALHPKRCLRWLSESGRQYNWIQMKVGDGDRQIHKKVGAYHLAKNVETYSYWILYDKDQKQIIASGQGLATASPDGNRIAIMREGEAKVFYLDKFTYSASIDYNDEPSEWKIAFSDSSTYVIEQNQIFRLENQAFIARTPPNHNSLTIKNNVLYSGDQNALGQIPKSEIWVPVIESFAFEPGESPNKNPRAPFFFK